MKERMKPQKSCLISSDHFYSQPDQEKSLIFISNMQAHTGRKEVICKLYIEIWDLSRWIGEGRSE